MSSKSQEILASILEQMPQHLKDEKTTDPSKFREQGYSFAATIRTDIRAYHEYGTSRKTGDTIDKVELRFNKEAQGKFTKARKFSISPRAVNGSTIYIPSNKLWEAVAEYIEARAADIREAEERKRKVEALCKSMQEAWSRFQMPKGFHGKPPVPWQRSGFQWENQSFRVRTSNKLGSLCVSYDRETQEYLIEEASLRVYISKPTQEAIEALATLAEVAQEAKETQAKVTV